MIWLILACGAPDLTAPLAPPRTGAALALESADVGPGEPAVVTLTLTAAPGWSAAEWSPEVEGLETAVVTEDQRQEGDRQITTRVFELTGPDGSYWIPTGEIGFTGPDGQEVPVPLSALYFDLGVDGPTSEIGELIAAPEPAPWPWPWIVGGALAAAALLVGGLLWARREKIEPPPPPPPPDAEALDAWARARRDLGGDDHALALALSSIFRRFLERTLELPATRMTRAELLERLRDDRRARHLLPSCKRLIDATDLIKFARVGGGAALFDELDGELRGVVVALKPAEPGPDAEGGA